MRDEAALHHSYIPSYFEKLAASLKEERRYYIRIIKGFAYWLKFLIFFQKKNNPISYGGQMVFCQNLGIMPLLKYIYRSIMPCLFQIDQWLECKGTCIRKKHSIHWGFARKVHQNFNVFSRITHMHLFKHSLIFNFLKLGISQYSPSLNWSIIFNAQLYLLILSKYSI